MKPKMHHQVPPAEIAPPRSAQFRIVQGNVEEEIQNFLQAVNTYPARVAKEPHVTFRQHLSSISAARDDSDEEDRRDSHARRH